MGEVGSEGSGQGSGVEKANNGRTEEEIAMEDWLRNKEYRRESETERGGGDSKRERGLMSKSKIIICMKQVRVSSGTRIHSPLSPTKSSASATSSGGERSGKMKECQGETKGGEISRKGRRIRQRESHVEGEARTARRKGEKVSATWKGTAGVVARRTLQIPVNRIQLRCYREYR